MCGSHFDPDHALICRCSGYFSLRHNELRDLTADLLREVCHDMTVEPELQPVTGESLPRAANKDDHARVDVCARGFWEN